ncbi:MAG TPA: DNA recombination protein RmuC, partial [Actinobacteria bacterium]|nr:DNA recombination protein RmuC [Actinomycetota bacterium]
LLRQELRVSRDEAARASRELREEVTRSQQDSSQSIVTTIGELGRSQKDHLSAATTQINELSSANEARMDKIRGTVDTGLRQIQESNEKKLEQMRNVVDEKLQSTLEKRLGESFSMVREQLEAVQRGLGEMQDLAKGVGDLKKVLTNVKTRGTWGEVQLGTLLEELLTPDQYSRNVQVREESREQVEYAIKLPGPREQPDTQVWLPIDAKFPQEDYLRLVDASRQGDAAAVDEASAALVRSIRASAKTIREKYLSPPETTDFAIMFLPTEGLYAEVLRQPGLLEEIQQQHRVVISGPTTLSAILSSLRMGFRTLAIEKRSSEVWQVLAAVKTEFGKFGDVLTKVKSQLNAAANTIEKTEVRTRAMERKLREVEQLPSESANSVLELAELDLAEPGEDGETDESRE